MLAAKQNLQAWGREAGEEEEVEAVCDYIVRHMKEDLYIELAQGMRLRQTFLVEKSDS